MVARLRRTLSVIGLLGILTACGAPAPVDFATASPSREASNSPTPESMVTTQPSPPSPGYDCQNIQEIAVVECQALIALYESTDGDHWEDNSGWLGDQTPCSWVGVICAQGHIAELQLFYNALSGSLPPEIGNLTHLKSLYLDGNELRGPVPAEIGNLTELQVARLGDNQFSSIPAELQNLDKLMTLELWGNQLSGEIPSGLENLSNLQELRLGSNELTGSIPPELGQVANLHVLDLSRNQLSGTIPETLGQLVSLNQLDLSFNQLTGTIPEAFTNLRNLYALDLSYNQLTGAVPASLLDTPILERRLWGNQLEGTVMAGDTTSTPVEYEGVQFAFPSVLASSVWPETVPGQEPPSGEPVWLERPEHVRFTFAYPRELADDRQIGKRAAFGPAQILIFPTETYGTMSEPARSKVEELRSLLETRPAAPAGEIPVLPVINAAQVFHAQVEYVDFQNGSGVRFITHYSQDVSPISNQNIFYTFQGLTQDGAYYVAVFFPVAAEGLSDEQIIEDWDAFGAGYPDYLTETVSKLDALSSDEFEPDLAILDEVIHSLLVSTP